MRGPLRHCHHCYYEIDVLLSTLGPNSALWFILSPMTSWPFSTTLNVTTTSIQQYNFWGKHFSRHTSNLPWSHTLSKPYHLSEPVRFTLSYFPDVIISASNMDANNYFGKMPPELRIEIWKHLPCTGLGTLQACCQLNQRGNTVHLREWDASFHVKPIWNEGSQSRIRLVPSGRFHMLMIRCSKGHLLPSLCLLLLLLLPTQGSDSSICLMKDYIK